MAAIETTLSSSVAAAPAAPEVDRRALKAGLVRAQRLGRVRAFLLVAPLLAFVLLVFVGPVGLLLLRAVDNRAVSAALPQTAVAMAAWDGAGAPPDTAWAAMVADLRAAPSEVVADVAKRLNYYQPGFRSLLIKSGRAARNGKGADAKALLSDADAGWGDVQTWQTIRRASARFTDFYLLAAVDLHRAPDGTIVASADDSAIYREAIGRTFWITGVVTFACLVLGFPVAWLLAHARPGVGNLLMGMVLLPFWTSLLVRTTAWVVLLQTNGVVNDLLRWLGVISTPLELIHNRTGVIIAMTHILLPFMVLPIYSVMRGIPPVFMKAAASLGAPPWRAFLRVYLPQTMPGIAAGTALVFILALGYYITPSLVGGPRDQMLSYFVAYFANQANNWGMAAALSVVLLAIVLVLAGVFHRLVGFSRVKLG